MKSLQPGFPNKIMLVSFEYKIRVKHDMLFSRLDGEEKVVRGIQRLASLWS